MRKSVLFSIIGMLVIAMSSQSYAASVDFSGQLRTRPETADNQHFAGTEKAFIGNRVRLSANVQAEDGVSAKITLQDVKKWGDSANTSTSQEEQSVDIFEAYFQVDSIKGSPLSLKIGRQTLVYGDQRLLGNLGWVDQGRTHDAFKAMLNLGNVKLDLFASKVREDVTTKGIADEDSDANIYGAYAVIGITDGVTLDVYALNWRDSSGGVQTKDIWTYGARAAVKVGGLKATAEGVIQSGTWDDRANIDQEAYAVAVKAMYSLGMFAVGGEFVSGSGDDDSTDNKQKTFVFPFHTNHGHYGYMDNFSWGNTTAYAIHAVAKPADNLTLKATYWFFQLTEGKGDWLNVAGTKTLLAAKAGSSEDQAGGELDLTAVYKASKSIKVVGGYSFFDAGDAVSVRGGDDGDSTWGYLMMIFNFKG
ncbi:hypothetical protein MNBD_NITROSPINAE01-518 [hydrothermal vent metagenome]|uniref:Alginate export domain-containing protein n=1 Tax=hydrothermal vent metagenome TaxID=652676 RepID=A0A3B1CIU9_9ZZZZ